MLQIEIPTAALADADDPGAALAALLRKCADRLERDVAIVPAEGDTDWATETYRQIVRVDGVVLGATLILRG